MLKAKCGGVMLLGLSDLNLQKLREGKPILFDGAAAGFPQVTKIAIFHAPTEEDMLPLLRSWGMDIPQ